MKCVNVGVSYSHIAFIPWLFLIEGFSIYGDSYFGYTPMQECFGHKPSKWAVNMVIMKSVFPEGRYILRIRFIYQF